MSHSSFWRRLVIAVSFMLLVTLSLPLTMLPRTVLAATNPNPGVLPPTSNPFGKTYGQWSNAWWQWAYSIPVPNNPVLDTTGAHCTVGQSGQVWFLAGLFTPGTITRTCTIPDGKALFFPIFNAENDNIGVTPPLTADQLRAALNAFFQCCVDPSTFSAEVDGVAIEQLGNYRAGLTNPPVFSFTLPVNNVYPGTPPAGTYSPVVSDGYYLMLAPLSTGMHTIHFVAPVGGLDVTYHLTVGT